jgi:hypothetical protein
MATRNLSTSKIAEIIKALVIPKVYSPEAPSGGLFQGEP